MTGGPGSGRERAPQSAYPIADYTIRIELG